MLCSQRPKHTQKAPTSCGFVFLLASAKQGLGLRDSKIFGGDSGAVQGRLEFPAPSLTKPEPAEFVVVAESDVWQLITKARRGIQLPVV